MKGGSTRAPRHDIEDGIFMLTCCIVGGESGDMYLTSWVEVAVTEALKECVDYSGVQEFTASSNGASDSMVEERVEWATTGSSGLVLWLMAASLW